MRRTAVVDFDTDRLRDLERVMGASSVSGSAQIRHAVFRPDGIHVYRHAGVSQAAIIPIAYVQRVLAVLAVSAHACVTGVAWEGQTHPDTVTVSRRWSPAAARAVGDADNAEQEPSLPFSVVRSMHGEDEFLQCNVCERLFVQVRHYAQHVCQTVRVVQTLLARGSRMAVQRVAFVGPVPVAALPLAPNMATVTRFEAGWACAAPRDVEKLDAAVTELLTQWFNDGEASGKTKCSGAMALQRLAAMRDVDGTPMHDEDSMPSEMRVKRLFSSLAQKKRAAGRVVAEA